MRQMQTLKLQRQEAVHETRTLEPTPLSIHRKQCKPRKPLLEAYNKNTTDRSSALEHVPCKSPGQRPFLQVFLVFNRQHVDTHPILSIIKRKGTEHSLSSQRH